jgi:hypothetical protein
MGGSDCAQLIQETNLITVSLRAINIGEPPGDPLDFRVISAVKENAPRAMFDTDHVSFLQARRIPPHVWHAGRKEKSKPRPNMSMIMASS